MRKKSIKKPARKFREDVDEILEFIERTTRKTKAGGHLSDTDESWCHDLAIVRVYLEFEKFMLNCLVARINIDPTTFSERKNCKFPKDMSAEVCEYLICGDGYFNFKGRDGLIKKIREVVPADHWLTEIVGDKDYTATLDKLSALRNFAAHESAVSKKKALAAIHRKQIKHIDKERILSSGAWLKKQDRLDTICADLKTMAQKIEDQAPY